MSSSFGKNVDFDKPRRLEEETADYLSQLEVQLAEVDDEESIEILVNNVLEEIKLRTASAASDRRTNYIIEKLCYAANISQLLEVLRRCTPYALFLVQNRYSSHVIQAMLSRLCFLFKTQAVCGVEDDILEATVLSFATEIFKQFKYVASDVCGSHVLRSLICLLAGVPVISERKGKASKHQHSVSLSEPLEKLLVADGYHIDSRMSFGVPRAFQETLLDAAAGLRESSTDPNDAVSASRELQELVANTCSGAVLGILLRVLFSPHIVEGGQDMALQLVTCAFEFDSSPAGAGGEDLCSVVYYAMAGDKCGSYFIETTTECCGLTFLLDLTKRGLLNKHSSSDQTSATATTSAEFVRDAVANFVLQSLMKRLCSEFMWAMTRSTYQMTATASEDELRGAVDLTNQLLSTSELAEPDLFQYIVKARAGVGLWMIKLGDAFSRYQVYSNSSNQKRGTEGSKTGSFVYVDPDVVLNRGDDVACAFLKEWSVVAIAGGDQEVVESNSGSVDMTNAAFEAQLDALLVQKLTGASGKLKDSGGSASNGGAIKAKGYKGAQVNKDTSKHENGVVEQNSVANLTSRVIGAILSLHNSTSCRVLSAALTRLPHSILLDISCFGPLSRCVMDAFFGCKSNGRDRSILLSSFVMPNIVSLANHPVGHHTLRKSFESASSVDKERIVTALCERSTRSQIANTREGKVILRVTYADLYGRSVSEWKALIAKQKKAEAMLLELETGKTEAPQRDWEEPSAAASARPFSQAKLKPPSASAMTKQCPSGGASVDPLSSTEGHDADSAPSAGRRRKRKHAKSQHADSEHNDAGPVNADRAEETRTSFHNTAGEQHQHKLKKHRGEDSNHQQSAGAHSSKHRSPSTSGHKKHSSSSSGDTSKADMKKIKSLKSGKMMSIKQITAELQR